MRNFATVLVALVAVLSSSVVALSTNHGLMQVRSYGPPSMEEVSNAYGPPPSPYAPVYDPHAPIPCAYDAKGWLTCASGPGCPIKVKPTPTPPYGGGSGHPSGPGCTPNNLYGSLLNISLLNCSKLCILSIDCNKYEKPCVVTTKGGSLLNVSALNCATVNLLSA